MLRINNIKIRNNLSDKEIFEITIQKNHIHPNDITKWYISKKSIDARNKNDIHYTYSIDIEVKNEKKYKNLEQIKEFELPKIQIKNLSDKKVVIIGAGPAGLFAALTLINNGIKPIVIEQGKPVEQRKQDIETFQKTGILNPTSNVQFGEGGAGTFSDGKLTTGINSPYCKKVLESLVHYGAPEEIL